MKNKLRQYCAFYSAAFPEYDSPSLHIRTVPCPHLIQRFCFFHVPAFFINFWKDQRPKQRQMAENGNSQIPEKQEPSNNAH